ncbi:hypothetical protein HS1genome_0516 [Sulfodiicoccus acidiphilus]|uniref:Uncharacterized protein n=1 Tax=Sulfodiicoccus acidiphilus TaxID=1670455 RepID=A0A348B1S5_9CREN|nr:hypothetical protein HS1genome_0516 [Sulfodiicoccus acidiphilus]GGT94789.1 hypothetical protein GCM10007116_10490 [Sulfodiicoccus acidiphilus]
MRDDKESSVEINENSQQIVGTISTYNFSGSTEIQEIHKTL